MSDFPPVTVIWHGLNDHHQHDVAAQATIKPCLDAMPLGFEFKMPDFIAHLQEAVRADIARKGNPEDYNDDIEAEVGPVAGGIAYLWTTNPYRRQKGYEGKLLEWIDEDAVIDGEISERDARYRRIQPL